MKLKLLADTFAVCRLAPDEEVPRWASAHKQFLSITYTPDELSIVCLAHTVPSYIQAEREWRALCVEGPLDFSLTGVLAAIATPLAAGGIPIFTISTYDTDYILVKEYHLERAQHLLVQYGHIIQ